ncbi:squalene synthase HpnD [Malikia spinosa]|uniref:Squalene synthase HpnD n=1 Tax=Malikia spinosa TaxID=86180 RepID=A0A2S9KFR9_9BURK|nr:presqualene diphosphate synthase HpnD [Malikia spinosa]OGB72509.1 MAG: squalene synthase HpnD [Burkholderiales bacterium RIFOXYC12_FULL_65_23]PRD69289.1 squalene synthase HpnD [Malikia spinosa]
MTPQEYAQQKAAASGSSFYYAFLFLPPERRAAITAFYAYCREIDDVVDEVSDPGIAQSKLDWWRGEVRNAFAGQASHPALQALLPHSQTFGIEARHLLQVIEGCEMDLTQTRYLDFANLKQYCHLVAGVVGEVAANIFGQTDPRTTDYAHRLGLALQLTNIIRDVGEDAVRGRVYLPIEDLQRFDVKAHELIKRGSTSDASFPQRFEALMQFQIERALATYDEALVLLPAQDRQAQKPGLMMASIYRTLLHEIAREPQLVLTRRVSLTPLRKLWLAWKVQALGRL